MKKMTTDTNRTSPRRSSTALIASLGAAALLMIPTVVSAQPAAPKSGRGWAKGPAAKDGQGRRWKRGQRGMRGKRGMRGRRGRRGGGPLMRAPIAELKKALSLTPAQVRKVKALRASNHRQKMMKLRQQKRLLHAKMRAEMLEQKPNLLKVAVLHGKLQKVKNKMSNSRFKMKMSAFRILTPDQRQKMRSMFRGHGRRHGRFGKRGGRGGFGKGHGRFGRGRGHGRRGGGGGFGGGW